MACTISNMTAGFTAVSLNELIICFSVHWASKRGGPAMDKSQHIPWG